MWLLRLEALALILVPSMANTSRPTSPSLDAEGQQLGKKLRDLVLEVLAEPGDGGVWSGTWLALITLKAMSSRQRRSIFRLDRSPMLGAKKKGDHHLGVERGSAPTVFSVASVERERFICSTVSSTNHAR